MGSILFVATGTLLILLFFGILSHHLLAGLWALGAGGGQRLLRTRKTDMPLVPQVQWDEYPMNTAAHGDLAVARLSHRSDA